MSEPRRYRITVDGHPMSPNKRNAASVKERIRDKRLYRTLVAMEARQAHQGPPLQHAAVTVTLVRKTGQFYDPDGATGCIKPALDGLTVKGGGGLLADDSLKHIVLDVRQAYGERRMVVIEIEEMAG